MKMLFTVSALMLAFTHVQAESLRLTAADGSELTALCIASASSERPLVETAKAYGISTSEIREISCNGIRLDRFANKYKTKVLAVAAPDANKVEGSSTSSQ